MTPVPTADQRLAQMAKRHADALLRDHDATPEQRSRAWKSLAEQVFMYREMKP